LKLNQAKSYYFCTLASANRKKCFTMNILKTDFKHGCIAFSVGFSCSLAIIVSPISSTLLVINTPFSQLSHQFLNLKFFFTVDDSPRIRRVLILGVTSLPFSFSMSSTLLFIGIGWVLYRPLIGIVLLFIATAPFLLAFHRIQQQRELEWRRSL
jgi:hypothetical protein